MYRSATDSARLPITSSAGPSGGSLWARTQQDGAFPVLASGLAEEVAVLACRLAGFTGGKLAPSVEVPSAREWTQVLGGVSCAKGARSAAGCTAKWVRVDQSATTAQRVAAVQCFNASAVVLGDYGMAPWRVGAVFPDPAAQWVSYMSSVVAGNYTPATAYPSFTKLLNVSATTVANLTVAADDQADVFLNGVYQGSVLGGWGNRSAAPVPLVLGKGRNNLTLRLTNYKTGPAGLLASLADVATRAVLLRTDGTWSVDVATALPSAVALGPPPLDPWVRVRRSSPGVQGAQWVWAAPGANTSADPAIAATFFGRFSLPRKQAATVCLAVAGIADLFVNGQYWDTWYGYGPAGNVTVQCARLVLPAGDNLLAARCSSAGGRGAAGLILGVLDGPVSDPNAACLIRSGADWAMEAYKVPTGGCPAMPGYVARPHTDYWGAASNRSFLGPSHVAANCSAQPGCRGFSLRGWAISGAVIQPTNLRQAPGSCFYTKLYGAATLGSFSMPPWSLASFPDRSARWIGAVPDAANASTPATYTPAFTRLLNAPFTFLTSLSLVADDQADVFLNGIYQGSVLGGWGNRSAAPVPLVLGKGRNILTLRLTNYKTGPAGLLASLAEVETGKVLLRSDSMWSANTLSAMRSAVVLGPAGMRPWQDVRPTASNGFAQARWIWSSPGANASAAPTTAPTFFRRFSLPSALTGARIYAAADDIADVFVNGAWVGVAGQDVAGWDPQASFLLVNLTKGENVIAVRCFNGGVLRGVASPAGLLLAVVDPRIRTPLVWSNETWAVEAAAFTGACPGLLGYEAIPESDHDGDSIGFAGSIADAMARCNADVACEGFNSRGWYKRSVIPTRGSAGTCTYIKASAWGWRRSADGKAPPPSPDVPYSAAPPFELPFPE